MPEDSKVYISMIAFPRIIANNIDMYVHFQKEEVKPEKDEGDEEEDEYEIEKIIRSRPSGVRTYVGSLSTISFFDPSGRQAVLRKMEGL